jgi:hypothetical protein
MKEITLEKLYSFYLDTVHRCGTYLLKMSDDDIEHEIFEEFDIGCVSFLFPDNLRKLYQGGYISLEKMNKSILLREKVTKVQEANEWDIESIRTTQDWKDILELGDEINSLI